MIKKPLWLDTILSITGIIITLVASFDLAGILPTSSKTTSTVALIAGIILIILVFLRKDRISYKSIIPEQLSGYLSDASKKFNEIVIFNPTTDIIHLDNVIKSFASENKKISIISDASIIYALLKSSIKDQSKRIIIDNSQITKCHHGEFAACIYSKENSKIELLYYRNEKAFKISFKDKELSKVLMNILKHEGNSQQINADLSSVSHPKSYLNTIAAEQKKYLSNFSSLRSGYISFFGNEVQNIQAGWVESGEFQLIRTLDLTTDPKILLTRKRYNEANKRFIESGGQIMRVYLIESHKLNHKQFLKSLIDLIKLQQKIGVTIGVLELETLKPDQKEDFIMYDNAVVLVQETQANFDYTFGKSSAYFDHEKLEQYEKIFQNVWSGRATGITPIQFAQQLLTTT